MKKNITFDLQTFSAFYSTHKKYLTPILMIVVSIILVFAALIPQLNDLFTTLSRRSEEMRKLQIEKNNLTILNNINEDNLNAQLVTSLRALPSTKDFESVLTTISVAAGKSAVSLGNFEFKVGDLSKSVAGSGEFPSLGITLIVNDGAQGTNRFLTSLAQSLPLSEVKSIDINGNYSTLAIAFYYKSSPVIKNTPDSPIVPVSAKQTETLNQLTSWSNGNLLPSPSSLIAPPKTSSSSATTPF